jgi:hypothetical protein
MNFCLHDLTEGSIPLNNQSFLVVQILHTVEQPNVTAVYRVGIVLDDNENWAFTTGVEPCSFSP